MSLSRSHRPQTFKDITGQESIKETLRKEVAQKRLGHAYLFSGPRGVGKTTTARIFAKAVNCLSPKDGEPCTTCASCTETQDGRSLDVIEMDAASHNGVEMVREAIIEHVRFAPVSRTYKVYILDEVHMLSTAAFNAFLKTLEEPPPYAMFILATTEFHKVPATIISRCQRFDFRRLSQEELVARIADLSSKENVKIDDIVTQRIAKYADGCARDAEMILDQLISMGEKHITDDVASLILPVSRVPRAAELLHIAGQRDLTGTLENITKLIDDGIPLIPFFDDLLEATRGLMIAGGNAEGWVRLQKGDEGERALAKLEGVFSMGELSDIALMLMERRRDAKQGIDARFALELATVAIAAGLLPHGPHDYAPPSPMQTPRAMSPVPAPELIAPIQTEPVIVPIPPTAYEATASIPSTPKPAASVVASLVTLAQVQRSWVKFVKEVDDRNKSLPFILKISRPYSVEGAVVTIAFQYPYHREKVIENTRNRMIIDEALNVALGTTGMYVNGIVDANHETPETKSTDMVSTIMQAFGGKIVGEEGPVATT